MRSDPKTLLLFVAVLLGCVGCDHASKQLAISTLSGTGSVSVVGDALRLQLAWNPGAFLSAGAGLPEGVRELLFIGAPPFLIAGLCLSLLYGRGGSRRLAVGLGLIAGGGLGNWIDRLLHDGLVADFLVLGLGPLRTGIFNVADVAVVSGLAVLLVTRSGAPPDTEPTA